MTSDSGGGAAENELHEVFQSNTQGGGAFTTPYPKSHTYNDPPLLGSGHLCWPRMRIKPIVGGR